MTNRAPSLSTLFLLIAASCGSGVVEFGPPREVPASQRPTVWDAPTKERLQVTEMGPVKPPATDAGARVWTGDTPAGWQSLPANPGKFRDAVWRVAGELDTDCYFTASVGGGVVGNLTRWYSGQFGQDTPAVEALQVVELAGQPGRLAEIHGTFNVKPEPKPAWAALIAFSSRGDQVASLKFTGPEAIVTANRDKFLALAKSLRSATASPDAKAPPIQPGQAMPDNHPPTGDTPMPPPHNGSQAPAGPAPFTATAPASWSPKAGSSRLLHHTFGTDSEIYISQLGGTLRSSLDIWRGEVSLPPMSDAEFAALPKIAFLGDDSALLDLTGKFQSMSGKQIAEARLLVAARLDGTTITFCKLVGPKAEVEGQLDAFRSFCGSVRRAE